MILIKHCISPYPLHAPLQQSAQYASPPLAVNESFSNARPVSDITTLHQAAAQCDAVNRMEWKIE